MKTVNTVSFQSPQFGLLSESQLQDLHSAALELLRKTGVRFYHQDAIKMLSEAGAFISDNNLVKFPARLVEDAISSVPPRIIMCDRFGEPAVFLEGSKVNFGTGSDCLNFLDYETGEHRKFITQDIINGYKLCDALPNIHFVMSIGLPADVDPRLTYDIQMALMLEHTTKPLVFVTNDKASCQRAINMAAAVAGGHDRLREEQRILLYSEPSSPLQQSETAIDKLLLMAEHQLPVVHSPGPLMGGTAPITMAAGLTMSLAEILSALVIHQLKQPGAPFVFGAGLHHMDMKAAQICYASPEFQLTKTAVAELGRWYGIPTWGYAGCSDAKVMDEQAAAEAMLSIVMAKLSGANLIHDVGYMESGLTGSYEMIVLSDELIGLADHLIKGIEVTPETLMLEELHRIGPGGHFLNTETTHQRFKEFWYPDLLSRDIRDTWVAEGELPLGDRLTHKVKTLIKEHKTEPLTKSVSEELEKIIKQADKETK